MSKEGSPARRRTVLWALGAVTALLLTLLILLQSSNLWKTLAVESASDTLILYALSSLNFFAFVIFGFIFLRNLVKLSRERRALQIGSKFKSRLWFYFVVVSVLPIMAMAVFSYLFMNRAIERWFTQIPEDVVREARLMQEGAIRDQRAKLDETVKMLATLIDGRESEVSLAKLGEAGDLACIEISDASGKRIASWEGATESAFAKELQETLNIVHAGGTAPSLTDGKGFDAASAQLSRGRTLTIIPHRFEADDVGVVAEKSLSEFDKLKDKQSTVRQIGFLTLGVLTFLLIFSSSWIALHVARGLTVPIKALAEAADELARGKLGQRVETFAEDELALLVQSFNAMSSKIESSAAELDERRRYIETILQSLSTGVVSFDGDGRVATINKAARRLFKLEDADFSGCTLEQVAGDENAKVLERLFGRARRIGFASENMLIKADVSGQSSATQVAATVSALPENESGQIGVVLVMEDLSELIAAQRASAWQEVARRMAHEIKNPLTPIQLSAERIAKKFEGVDPVVTESTDTIVREVASLKEMVDEFSRFARLPEVRLGKGSLNEVIKNAVAAFEGRDVEIRVELTDTLPEVNLDEEQLKRVFVNLIENAIEAMEQSEKKTVTVMSHFDSTRETVTCEVSDSGPGIPSAAFPKLFLPYFSTKGRGTGLGLAIVQRIVTEHGAKIRAANKPEGGAKFIIEIPVQG